MNYVFSILLLFIVFCFNVSPFFVFGFVRRVDRERRLNFKAHVFLYYSGVKYESAEVGRAYSKAC